MTSKLFHLPVASARKTRQTEVEVGDTASLSGMQPARTRTAGPWRTLGLLVGMVVAVNFAGPLAYSVNPIQPDASQISIQQDIQSDRQCQPSGTIIPGTPAQQERLGRVAHTLQGYSHRPEIDYRFLISQMKQPNAESCAGGKIALDQEVVAELDDQELLFVAAHEQGHVEARHLASLQSFQQQAFARQFGIAALLPGYLEAVEQGLLDQARGQETQADCYALGVLQSEGIPAEKAASALQKVEGLVERRLVRTTGGGGDHPATSKRIEHLLQGCRG